MSLVKATEMERIDPFAIQPTKAEEIDRTLEKMWRSGGRSREGRLCVLRSADGVHVDALRRFAKRVSRRLPAAKIEYATLGLIVQHSSDAIYRPIVVVRAKAPYTPKSVLKAAAKALGILHHPRMSVAETCARVQAAADHQQTRIIIFDNLPHNFGGELLADALRHLRMGGSQIVCILRETAGNQRG
jgi:hypothetical protein